MKQHRDRDYISNFWKSVEKEMALPQWTDQECRMRGKNLRDTFRRKLFLARNTKNGQATMRGTKWVFYESLMFLIPYMANPITDTNVPSDSHTECTFEDFDDDETLSKVSGDRSLPSTSTPSVAKRAKNKGDSAWEYMVHEHRRATLLFSEQMSKHDSSTKSASQVFLESFATRMDALPLQIQSVVRIQIAQIFHNAENVGRSSPIPLTPFQSDSDQYHYQYPYSQI